MKKYFSLLLFAALSASSAKTQTIRHLSADIADYSGFYATQTQTKWCWAACNQMLLTSQGIQQTQEQQVLKLFDELVNRGAGDNYELAKVALAGTYTNDSGETVTVTPYISYLHSHNDDALVIIDKLNQGIPIVMATRQHGRVCVGVDYDYDGKNYYQITALRLLNPFNNIGLETISLSQFMNPNFEWGGGIGFMTFNIE